MKLQGRMKIGNKRYPRGSDVPWYGIYPFFLLHMLIFGGSGFLMAYAVDGPPLLFLYVHGGLAILVYTAFYVSFFGPEEVKWMFINAGLGVLGIYTQIGWLLSLFGKNVSDYPIHKHVIPFLYFVLYTFLLRQLALDMMNAREEGIKKKLVESGYVVVSVSYYLISYFAGKG